MQGQHHDLSHEFPEFKEQIHKLKLQDNHFKKICAQYEEIDKQISRSEARIELMSEADEENLRKQRLKLKDQIYSTLCKAQQLK